ncbi:MAG: DUF1549 domain-containing protein [Pirellulaceae bacterium]|nr:DUF1549 domain-containing protein [Pirellulaceae bacterium]
MKHSIIAFWPSMLLISTVVSAQETDRYEKQIKPLFTEKCITCHGALRAEAELRLDAIQFIRAGSESGSIVTSEGKKASKLLERVSSKDPDLRMPPEEAGTALTEVQIDLLSKWIDANLEGPAEEPYLESFSEHWAYQKIVRPKVPEIASENLPNPIDRFVQAAQQEKHVRSLQPASDAVWLRRIVFDVTGLPPSVEEIQRFTESTSPHKRGAIIDEMLARPSYGERWGRHWMDVWRYSDWDGYKAELRSSQRHIWHWRDWIVESLNANKPYNEMIVDMLSADELAPQDLDRLRATGFLARNYHKSNRNIWLDATVEHTAKAFLGMTLNCAKCHDHKYDPIPQTAYYQFRAIFEPHRIRTDQLAGFPDIEKEGIPRAFDADPAVDTFLLVRGNEKNPDKERHIDPAAPEFLNLPFDYEPVELPIESYYPELSPLVRSNVLTAKLKAEKNAIAKLNALLRKEEDNSANNQSSEEAKKLEEILAGIEFATSEVKLAIADRISTVARYAAEEAKYLPSGPVTKTNDTEQESNDDPSSAKSLAREAAVSEHGYQRVKGSHDVLLKQRAFDSAVQSKEPDAAKKSAAIKTAETGLDKAKESFEKIAVVLESDSVDYTRLGPELPRQSTGRRSALAKWLVHADNPLTARVAINHIWLRHFGTPLVENTFDFGMSAPKPQMLELLNWLAAEFVSSGWDMKHIHRLILESNVYATSSDDGNQVAYRDNTAQDRENATLWRADVRRLDAEEVRDSLLSTANVLDETLYGPDIDFMAGDTVMRRSLYFRHAYEKQMPMMVLFDAASPNECYRRKPSLVPQQALALANSSLARRLAKQLADNAFRTVTAEHSTEDPPTTAFVDRLFQATLGRAATTDELKTCEAYLASQTKLLSDPTSLTRFSDEKLPDTSDVSPEERARQSLAIVLFNHHEFVSIR